MKINRKLLPIKAHYFFFMCAMGPILPQLPVFGKEMGISPVVMGTISGLLPFAFLIAKPVFGLIVDIYRNKRKCIFILLIVIMTTAYALMNFIPTSMSTFTLNTMQNLSLSKCNINQEIQCTDNEITVICKSTCAFEGNSSFRALKTPDGYKLDCSLSESYPIVNNSCHLKCEEDLEATDHSCLYKSVFFWCFVALISIGTIGFNVVNSISDAICFDVIGAEYDYGKQRVWGTIGFGLSALVSGYLVHYISGVEISYAPAFIVMLVCSLFDIIACFKLELPIIETPKNFFDDLIKLSRNRNVIIFAFFAIFAGIVDSAIIYFLFWYLEDMSGTSDIKLLEGLIVAAETLGGEVIFFSVAGKILDRLGHVHCLSTCFVNYALRLGLISIIPSPWWLLPIEFCLQGPTYALTYTTIVAYANNLAPPGTSATMQGIAAGLDDGLGYAIGSFLAGIFYKQFGGRHMFQIFSCFALLCGLMHAILHWTLMDKTKVISDDQNGDYKSPEEAYIATYGTTT